MAPPDPIISIATPTYSQPKYLAATLDSVIAQRVPTESIVCVGGGAFPLPLDKYSAVRHESLIPDPGLVRCWDHAASMARGKYLAFLADDNTLAPNYSEKMAGFLDAHPECDLVFCNQAAMNADGVFNQEQTDSVNRHFGRASLRPGMLDSSIYPQLIRANAIPMEAMLMRRELWQKFGPFDDRAAGALDLHLVNKLLIHDARIGFISDCLVNFRWHENSYTSTRKLEHTRGSLWSVNDLIGKSRKYDPILSDLQRWSMYALARLDIPRDERRTLIRGLARSPQGHLILARYFVNRLLRRA